MYKTNTDHSPETLSYYLQAAFGYRITLDTHRIPVTPTTWATAVPVLFNKKPAFARIIWPQTTDFKAIQQEAAVAKTLGDLGLAPNILNTDLERGIIVMEAINSDTPPSPDQYIRLLGYYLQRLHNSAIDTEQNLALSRSLSAIERIPSDIFMDSRFTVFNTIKTLYVQFNTMSSEQCFCHNDLNPSNILYANGNIQCIDFDHCGYADPYFDLATVSLWSCNTMQQYRELLTAYLNTAPTSQQQQRLQQAQQLCLLRYAIVTFSFIDSYDDLPPANSWDNSPTQPFTFASTEPNHTLAVYKLACIFAKHALETIPQPH